MLDGAILKEEMWESLTKMDALRSAGLDGIHPAIVKTLAEALKKPCTQLLNESLDEGRSPAEGLTSTVIPVHKRGDRDKCTSYRPVSLTSTMLKTLESGGCELTVNHPVATKLLTIEQHGYG